VTRLLPLFVVSACTLGFEVALTRYFAVAKWSEYGYWVISIVLAGFALSGVVMALTRDWFAARAPMWLSVLPVLMIVAGAVGYSVATANPFNPLQLQNPVTFTSQLWLIAGYYAALLPFFFLGGLFVSLSFVHWPRPGRVYAADLTGAGAGTLLVLGLMFFVHPFRLVAYLLPLLAVASAAAPWRRSSVLFAALLTLGPSLGLLLNYDQATYNDYKAIYAPLHVPDSRVVRETTLPRGLYTLLDDFTERVDTDVSNDAAMLGLPGPPRTWGLYRDGGRIAAIAPEGGAVATPYAPATLAALPYAMLSHPRVLLAGGSGGFRTAEATTLGAASVDVAEPEPVLRGELAATAVVRVHRDGPLTLARDAAAGSYDLVDISGDFLDAAEGNSVAFTAEALAADLRAVGPSGIVSVPVSIREFPAYALRMLATARAALRAVGVADPANNVIAYRSAWNVRILLSQAPFGGDRIATARSFCGARSFDLSYYPGIDPETARAGVFNDLPAVSFEQGTVTSGGEGAHDAITDEAEAALAGKPSASSSAFDLAPITLDRPAFYNLLRLTPSSLPTILQRVELLPQAEIAPLVNLAVLAQAAVIALIVLIVPLFGGRRLRPSGGGTLRAIAYFAALGLGFFCIEIYAIEQASVLLADRTLAFALVLTTMLVGSGLGSLLADRVERSPRRVAAWAAGLVIAWCALAWTGAVPLALGVLGWPVGGRVALLLLALAPVSVALGLLFPLGLARSGAGFLPWAWALNGAFSVVATPLANLIALSIGYDRLIQTALVMYALAATTFPRARIPSPWSISASPAVR